MNIFGSKKSIPEAGVPVGRWSDLKNTSWAERRAARSLKARLGEAFEQLLARGGGLRYMADGLFYHDLREPFVATDVGAVTLSTTAKALYTPSFFPVLGGQYFARVGKKLRIRLFGRMTTVLTPNNGSFNVYYGNGTDANGTVLMTGAPVALSASQTSLSWEATVYVHCRSTGSVGTLFCTGKAHFNVALIASTLQPILLPASLPAVSGACDLTAANIVSVQYLRSGSTAETMQVHDIEVTACN